MTVDFIPIFPELVFMCPVKPATGILEYIDDLRANSPREYRSVNGGWETTNNLHLNESFYGRFIKDYFLPEWKKELHPINFPDFDITSLWVSEVNKGGYHHAHCHPGSDMAFIWYLKTSDKKEEREGDLCIENPKTYESWNIMQNLRGTAHPDLGTPLSTMYHIAPTFSVRPEPGLVLMLPSYLLHQVVPSQIDSRITMSGNIVFKKDQPQRVQEPYMSEQIFKEVEQQKLQPKPLQPKPSRTKSPWF